MNNSTVIGLRLATNVPVAMGRIVTIFDALQKCSLFETILYPTGEAIALGDMDPGTTASLWGEAAVPLNLLN